MVGIVLFCKILYLKQISHVPGNRLNHRKLQSMFDVIFISPTTALQSFFCSSLMSPFDPYQKLRSKTRLVAQSINISAPPPLQMESNNSVAALYAVRVGVGFCSSLSVLGACAIILSYAAFPELRTTARQLLLNLSITDIVLALARLLGLIENAGWSSHNVVQPI